MEGSLHTHWDYYGNFLILPQLSDLHKLLDALKESNTEWQQQADAFGSGPRPLDVSDVYLPRLPLDGKADKLLAPPTDFYFHLVDRGGRTS